MDTIKHRITDSFENKNKLRFYAYEFFGTALITFGFNMSGGSWTSMYLIALWICWEPSCAHFNSAISLAALLFNIGKIGDHLVTFIILSVVQFAGGMFGIFMTWLASHVEY